MQIRSIVTHSILFLGGMLAGSLLYQHGIKQSMAQNDSMPTHVGEVTCKHCGNTALAQYNHWTFLTCNECGKQTLVMIQ